MDVLLDDVKAGPNIRVNVPACVNQLHDIKINKLRKKINVCYEKDILSTRCKTLVSAGNIASSYHTLHLRSNDFVFFKADHD